MAKKYRTKFDSKYENYFKVHIGDNIVKFPDNDEGIYIRKLDNIFSRKWLKRTKLIWLKD